LIRAQKEINDLRFDNQRKEAKLKELEDSYKDFSEHTTEAVEYLLDDKTKYKPMRFSNVSNTMGPENIEQPENEMGEMVNEHDDDDDGNHGDYQEDDEQYDEDENHGDEHHGDYQEDDKNDDDNDYDDDDADDDDSFTQKAKREIEEADRIYNERLKKFQEDQKRRDELQIKATQHEELQDQPTEEPGQETQPEELQNQPIVGESIFAEEEQEEEEEDEYVKKMRLEEEEADRISRESFVALQQGQPQQKTITPQTDEYFDDDISESYDPNEDPFTDTVSLIEEEIPQDNIVVPTTAGSAEFVNTSQTQHHAEQKAPPDDPRSLNTSIATVATPHIKYKSRYIIKPNNEDFEEEYKNPQEKFIKPKTPNPQEYHLRQSYKLHMKLLKEAQERSKEKQLQKIKAVRYEEVEESRPQTRSVTQAQQQSQIQQSRPQTRSVTQSQQNQPIYTTILPVTKGKENAEKLKDYYFNELEAPPNEHIKSLQRVSDLRAIAANYAKRLYREVGGKNSKILRSGNADEIYDEYLTIKGISPEDIRRARREYMDLGGDEYAILNSKNINRIKKEIKGLRSMTYYKQKSR
jgi:hypothetical protein